MDQKELQKQIALFYSRLPPNAQALFSSMEWLETLKKISQKYKLTDEQIETLGTETTLALLGIIHLVEYEEALTNELRLPRNLMDKMMLEIEETIIKTIRPQLVEAFEANKNAEAGESPDIESKLDERFERLPKETQNIVLESKYRTILYNIARSYNLNVEQTGILESAATSLVTGAIRPEEFENSLNKNLRLPSETIKKIVSEISEKIFKKIREELVKNTGKKPPSLDYPAEDIVPVAPPTTSTASEKATKEDSSILTSAGIEIVPEKLELEPAEKPLEKREEMLQKIEKPEPPLPPLAN